MKQSFAIAALFAVSQAAQLFDAPHLYPATEQNFEDGIEITLGVENSVDYPGHRCCDFYDAENWSGGPPFKACLKDGYTKSKGIMPDDHLGKVSSYWCGKDISFDLCFDDPNTGNCRNYNGVGGAGNQRISLMGGNDKMRYYWLYEYDPIQKGAVTVFNAADCRSFSGRFFAGDAGTTSLSYNMDDMWSEHTKNDTISSVMVPYGYKLKLWDASSLTGDSDVTDGKYVENDSNLQLVCHNVSDFNDRTSGLEVIRSFSNKPANSYWVRIQAQTQPFTASVHYGHHTSSSSTDTITNLEDLKYEETFGVEFDNEKMSFEYQHMTQK